MQHQEFESPIELRDSIKCFWYNNRDFGDQESSFEVMPDGYAEIIFHFGNTLCIYDNGAFQPLPSPFMMGLLNHPARFCTVGRLQLICIRCFPWTVFDLLGLPAGKAGVRIFEHPIARLQPILNDLLKAKKITKAIAHAEQYFLNARSHVPNDSMLVKAGVAMTEAKGTLPVSQVAAAAHATVRTLERKFKESSGHTVKDVSGLMRFEQARNQLWLYPTANLAGLASELGYTDQAHLTREFKRYSGSTPASFARNAKRDKRALSTDFVAFIQA